MDDRKRNELDGLLDEVRVRAVSLYRARQSRLRLEAREDWLREQLAQCGYDAEDLVAMVERAVGEIGDAQKT